VIEGKDAPAPEPVHDTNEPMLLLITTDAVSFGSGVD
jgi:hypothetical protein